MSILPSRKQGGGKPGVTSGWQRISRTKLIEDGEIPDEFQPRWSLVKSLFGHRHRGEERLVGLASRLNSVGMRQQSEEAGAEVARRLPGVEYKLDQLRMHANAAKSTISVVERF